MTNTLRLPSSEEVFISLLLLKNIFSSYGILGCQFLLFQHLKDAVPFIVFWHLCFLMKNLQYFQISSPICNVSFFPAAFKSFPLFLVSAVLLGTWVWNSLHLFCIWFTKLLETRKLCLSPNLEVFKYYFFKKFIFGTNPFSPLLQVFQWHWYIPIGHKVNIQKSVAFM